MRRRPGQRPRQLRAIIWVPEEDRERWEAECLAHCERQGYEVMSLVVGGKEKWSDIWQILTGGTADVCVIHSRRQVPDRLPRLEAVTEGFPVVPAQRRTGRVRRWSR